MKFYDYYYYSFSLSEEFRDMNLYNWKIFFILSRLYPGTISNRFCLVLFIYSTKTTSQHKINAIQKVTKTIPERLLQTLEKGFEFQGRCDF